MKNISGLITKTFSLLIVALNALAAPPQITSEGPDEVSVDSTYAYVVQASDPEQGSLTYSFDFSPPNMIISQSGVVSWATTVSDAGRHHYKVVVEDEEGLTDQEIVKVDVVDPNNNEPEFLGAPINNAYINSTYIFDSQPFDQDGDNLIFSVSSWPTASGLSVDINGIVSWSPSLNDVGEYWVWVTADDQKFGNSQIAYSLSVFDPNNNDPVIGNKSSDIVINVGESYSYDLQTSDVDGDTLSYSFQVWPQNPGPIISNNGVVEWVPTVGDVGDYGFIVGVDDSKLGKDSHTYVVTVIDTGNVPPVYTSSPIQTVQVGASYQYNVDATDADNDTLGYSMNAYPEGMVIDSATGVIDWNPSAIGDYNIEVSVSDGVTTPVIQSYILSVVTPPNTAPNAGDQNMTLNEDSNVSITLTAFDGEEDPLIFSIIENPQNGVLSGTIPNLIYTPNINFSGADQFTFIVSDGEFNSNVATIDINVFAVNDEPLFTSSPLGVAELGVSYEYDVDAFDPDGDNLMYGLIAAPAGMTISAESGQIIWVPSTTGSVSVEVSVNDGQASAVQSFLISVLQPNNVPELTITRPYDSESFLDIDLIQFIASANDVEDGDIGFNIQWESSIDGFLGAGESFFSALSIGDHIVTAYVTDSQSGYVEVLHNVSVSVGPTLPQDPITIAPPLEIGVANGFKNSIEFLYSGANPIQTGVNVNDIVDERASVIRGKVLTNAGQPLAGVTVRVKDHPEFGQTLSRNDGMYDLVVNAGSQLVLNFDRLGYLPSQRRIDTTWRGFSNPDDVVMLRLDPQVNTIQLDDLSSPFHVAQGSVQEDYDGVRQTTILFPSGTSASLELSDGSIQSISTLNVRATEYTVGLTGPQSMPGDLPLNSSYTFAVELSVDEAISLGARTVNFDRPLPVYVSNFLSFPIGEVVPSGWYDSERAQWIPSESGLVIQVLSVVGGLAELDVDGSGTPAQSSELAILGITDEELEQLAQLFQVGASLWRVPVEHFTAYDFNWLAVYPDDAVRPSNADPQIASEGEPLSEDNDMCTGCFIEAQSQLLGEQVPVVGTPFSLSYKSDRATGYKAGQLVDIVLSDETTPVSLENISARISIAGRTLPNIEFDAAPGLSATVEWDGMDAYGREVPSAQMVVTKQYFYPVEYVRVNRFGAIPENSVRVTSRAVASGGAPPMARKFVKPIVNKNPDSAGLGGWSLSSHHSYDPGTQHVYFGDGTKQRASSLLDINVVERVAGDGNYSIDGLDGVDALETSFGPISDIEFDTQGNMYVVDFNRIRRIGTDGVIETVAGNGVQGFSGDGGLATDASLNTPIGIDISDDGTLYIADWNNNRVRAVSPDGIINTIAGTGISEYNGDNIPADTASLDNPSDVKVAPDGSIYIADTYNARVRRIAPDGIIHTVAGNGSMGGFEADGVLATETEVRYPTVIDFSPTDNSLFILQHNNYSIRRVDTSGVITRITGTGLGESDDGVQLGDAVFREIFDFDFSDDGTMYLVERGNHQIRKVPESEIVTTLAGTGERAPSPTEDGVIDGDLAVRERLWHPRLLSTDRNGDVYYVKSYTIRKVGSALESYSINDIAIPSRTGEELYLFDKDGRHLNTLNTLTGSTIFSFVYTSEGLLNSVTDAYGNIVSIMRAIDGTPTGIQAPDGQITNLGTDGNGYLNSITNPAGENYLMVNSNEGLMTQFTDRRGYSNIFTYDSLGRLIQDEDPAGGGWLLSRSELLSGYQTALRSGEDTLRTFEVDSLDSGVRRQINTNTDGSQTTIVFGTDGTELHTTPDGTQIFKREGADPRFGLLAPLVEEKSVTTPGGLVNSTSFERMVTLSDPTNLLSVSSIEDTFIENNLRYTSSFDGSTLTWVRTTPEGRQKTTVLNANGRIVSEQVPGIADISYQYDSRGRLDNITQGSGLDARTVTISYSTDGYIEHLSDTYNRITSFEYDNAGRLTEQLLPGSRTVIFNYDANDNVEGITPPGKPEHQYIFSSVDTLASYTPPGIGGDDGVKTYTYNLDKQLTAIEFPSGEVHARIRETSGRIDYISEDINNIDYVYDGTTGQVTNVNNGSVNTSYAYDGFLTTAEIYSGSIVGSVEYEYDNNFRLIGQTVNSANTISFVYDEDGLITSAGELTLGRELQNGLLDDTSIGVVSSDFSHTIFAELSDQVVSVSGSSIYNVHYNYDNIGRISNKIEIVEGVTHNYIYGYDDAGRLESVTLDGAIVELYGYDGNDNRLSGTVDGVTSSGTINARDQLLQYGNTTYTYDLNGAIETKTEGVNVTTYTYDPNDNLRQVELPDNTLIEYIIDGSNRRLGKWVNGTATQAFLYKDQINPIAELDSNGNIISRFIYAEKAHVPALMSRGGVTYRIISDNLGSVRMVLNTIDGSISQRLDYDSYGRILLDTNPGFQPFAYAGGIYDQDTGLTRFGARDYDAEVGRWLQVDPIGLQAGGNVYAYVGGNPIMRIDPLGLDWVFENGTRTLSQTDSSGNVINTWPAGSGPWGNGELPVGNYTLPSGPDLVPPSHSSQASYCDGAGNCWWQPITPSFPTNRTGLGIHPDGNVPGTAGCVGVTSRDTADLYDALLNDQGPLTVR